MFLPTNVLLKKQLAEISDQFRTKNHPWFEKRGISISDKGDLALLNFIPEKTPNHWNFLTKGLLLDRAGTVYSFPFTRIFSLGSQYTPENINLINCDLVEKIDGQMICISFPSKDHRRPFWHTAYHVNSSPNDWVLQPLFAKAQEYIKTIPWSFPDLEMCFIFEMIHEKSIIEYPKSRHGFVLVGARRMKDFADLSETELDSVAKRLRVKRPERWHNISGWSDIERIRKEFCDDYEGLIIRDSTTGERAKLQTQKYIGAKREIKPIMLHRRNQAEGNTLLIEQTIISEPDTSAAKSDFKKDFNEAINGKIQELVGYAEEWKRMNPTLMKRGDLIEYLYHTKKFPAWTHKYITDLLFMQRERWEDYIKRAFFRMNAVQLKHMLSI